MPTRRVLAAAMVMLLAVTIATPGVLFAATPASTPPPASDPTPAPSPTLEPASPPTSTPMPSPTPSPSVAPTPVPVPITTPPATLDLFRSGGFRYQDPNGAACTATSVMDMLNFIKLGGRAGADFTWSTSLTSAKRDSILSFEQAHDTMAGGRGTDVHGWRNALNAYGWGSSAMQAGKWAYQDFSFAAYASAMKAAVRAMISTGKPVALAAWAGRHAVMITGYYGLRGNPFARNGAGAYTNTFTVGGFYLSDPLRVDGRVNVRVGYTTLGGRTDPRLAFRPYLETDSPYDDPYTPGWRSSRSEWYGKWVLILPVR